MSSKMKKMSLSPRSEAIKRKHEDEQNLTKKQAKCNSENPLNENIFMKACEIVSTKIDEDMLNRFHLQSCLRNWVQRNTNSQEEIYEMRPHAEETFNIEMKSNKWYEALQISFLSITPTQYLSVNVLKNIVEIMLNAHEDPLSEYHMTYLIAKCQQVLSLNLRMHPPRSIELWKHYKQFLTSPMDLREETLTNRKNYGSEFGIYNYCIDRLISELSADSIDGPFFNKEDKVPENLQKIQEMHWIKSKLEIYEMLNRTDRIDRLMAVMDSLVELLGFDLALFHSRKDSQQRGMKRLKPLMLEFLESYRIPTTYTNHDIQQKFQTNVASLKIIQIFVYFVHLNYPEKYIKTMSLWINILVESIHVNRMQLYHKFSDNYKPGAELLNIANKFDSVMSGLPPESILKIFENITAAPVKYSLAVLYVQKLWDTAEVDIVRILINIVKNCRWNDFPESTTEIKPEEKETPKCITSDNILKQLAVICKNHKSCNTDKNVYLKFETVDSNFVTDRNYAMRILYITFQAYLDNYKVHRLQKTLLQLKNESNENQLQDNQDPHIKKYSRNAIIPFIAMYRTIYNGLKDYFCLLKSLKSKNELPEIFYNFEKIIDLDEL